MSPTIMHIIFSLMDAEDDDGRAAHILIFLLVTLRLISIISSRTSADRLLNVNFRTWSRCCD